MNSKPVPWPFAKSVTLNSKQYIEEVIYKSEKAAGITILGDSPILLTNRMETDTNNCLTIVRNIHSGEVQTSYNITKVIGHQKYNTVFAALLSVINPEIRVKGILALLTKQDKLEMINVSTQTHCDSELQVSISPNKTRKMRKRKMDPYVVLDDSNTKVRKADIKTKIPPETNSENDIDIDIVTLFSKNTNETLRDQSSNDGNDSILPFDNISLGNISKYSFHFDVFNQLDNLIDNDNYTDINEYHLNLNNGEYLKLPFKPEDILHLATPDILQYLNKVDAMKLIQYQQFIDCISCLERDEDNFLPIHNAVVNNDIALIWRHCPILKCLQGTVDVEMDEELTPLHLALQLSNMAAASLLLRHNADVIVADASERCSLHHATNQEPEAVELLEKHCKKYARAILSQEPDIWSDELASKTDEDLKVFLGNLLGSKFDIHGYTPLMLAARAGWNDTVSAILSLSPDSINLKSRIAGETALYLAVSAACVQAENKGYKDKISDDYINTVKVLISQGADPKLENHTGLSTLSILSTEFNHPELSLIVNSSKNVDLANLPKIQALSNCMLVRNNTGEIQLEQVNRPKANNNEPKSNKAVYATLNDNNITIIENKNNLNNTDINNKISTGQNSKTLFKLSKLNIKSIENKNNLITDNIDDTSNEIVTSNLLKNSKIVMQNKDKSKIIIKFNKALIPPKTQKKYKIVRLNNHSLNSLNCANVFMPKVKNKMSDVKLTKNIINNMIITRNEIEKPISDTSQTTSKRPVMCKKNKIIDKSVKQIKVKILSNELIKNTLPDKTE